MKLQNGATYRLENRADGRRSLNVYGNAPANLANVCLWNSDDNDICQQWVFKVVDGHRYFVCKGAPGLALDLFTGSSATANVNNFNAHVYAPSSTSCLVMESASDGNSGYCRIRLENNTAKYLTANQGSNGTGAGRDVNAAGNVYWYKGGLTDYSQDWKLVLIEEAPSQPEPGKYNKNYLIYPTMSMNITQNPTDSNHNDCSTGLYPDYPIDEGCEDAGRSYFYCPCDEMVVTRVYTTGTNTIWFESTSPVVTPSGTYDKISIMVMHPNDSEIVGLKRKYFTRGEPMFREGDDGAPNNNHFHISAGTGSYNGGPWENGWYGPKGNNQFSFTPTGKTLRPEEAFFVDPQFTTIRNKKGINFKNVPAK